MVELSPAAQAVLTAIWNAPDNVRDTYRAAGAAALRAAADQVVPKTPTLSYPEDYELGVWVANDDTRTELLAIAAELEEQALVALQFVDEKLDLPLHNHCNAIHTIRRALEALDD